PEFVRGKLDVLREHCERVGRRYEDIEKSVLTGVNLDEEDPAATVERFSALAEAGAEHIILSVRGVADASRLERIASEVFPKLRER
ncbi:MAG TPA: LLM class F420-dependent oxidoreductase, partial [Candidatus Limnocylindria bacterium]|nr:LLM class F420-dependent oxidoreductase [Candidatus Limnocylindria bacterium]